MHLVFRNKVDFVQEASDLLGAADSECDVRFLLTGVVGVALKGNWKVGELQNETGRITQALVHLGGEGRFARIKVNGLEKNVFREEPESDIDGQRRIGVGLAFEIDHSHLGAVAPDALYPDHPHIPLHLFGPPRIDIEDTAPLDPLATPKFTL
jgi:hypothetical protein